MKACLKERAPLTPEQKSKIWEAIERNTWPDDREPREVIEEKYNGDEEAYLREMAEWLNVK